MSTRIFQVDSFTDRPFAGNPAGVCVLAAERDEQWMQNVAAEMNVSETAFLQPKEGAWSLRWFTPTTEVKLCGHATLASAHVLWEAGLLPAASQARFDTQSGRLTADRKGEWIEMDFPAQPVVTAIADLDEPARLLGVKPLAAWDTGWIRLVELAGEADVRAAAPDFAAMAAGSWGIAIVTARSDLPRFDFVSRCFAPAAGINEDPVTGVAHCTLAPFWGARLGRTELVGYQASRRGGVVRVRTAGERVRISGQAVTTLKGEIT